MRTAERSKIAKLSDKSGLPPGTPVYTGERSPDETKIRIFLYTEENYEEKTVLNLDELKDFSAKTGSKWVIITGLANTQLINDICEFYGMHPLTTEDILNTHQRPKIESFDDYIYIVIKVILPMEDEGIYSEQASIILFKDTIITFLENDDRIFEPLIRRLTASKGRLRKNGNDYLFYAIIDSVVDEYFEIFEIIGERLERIEDSVIISPEPEILEDIYSVRRDLIWLRKSIWPLRDVVAQLSRGEYYLISDNTEIFLRDVHDHLSQISETLETYRDLAAGLLDLYLSGVSNRMNEVMKVLTIIATIFIPLTFIAGLYGMNFSYMPELNHPYAYPGVLLIMLAIAVAMLIYFRKKRWL
ncbi:magnesium and cobalt transport protein CorA [Methanolacinia petrolearia DSM 11571]|uniref:Magnesium transport protein CorA n=1 Tax=Methanolacinia petrolearia (strain DSM 11571 / OCM 486 / SEBR 4847) TaxID=679926 RepID=E1RK58_METP4|nr:magnesium/cobalt transporter CorA [Methanolacinia petrolearia]ADN35781.1 magnesium and cobalt transport protein CorA [Methanolacinia petrolearia DSM 11571]